MDKTVIVSVISVLLALEVVAVQQQVYSLDLSPRNRLQFSWKSCSADPNPIINFTDINISPDPIRFGGSENISLTIDVKSTLGSQGQKLSAHAAIKMYMEGKYIDLCPLFPKDTCHIDDVCKKIAGYAKKCPEYLKFIGLNCTCPIPAREYKVPPLTVDIPSYTIGIDGAYDITLNILLDNVQAGCLNVKLCINTCKPGQVTMG